MEVHSASIDNIKSPYILRKLLSLLCETKKLDLLIYNKRLQNKMKINIENYKNIRYKYKIAEGNGKGKEYIINTNIIIFESKNLNGKRNGKAKEYYDNGELEFEYEYLNGKIWNGKFLNKNRKIEYEIKNGNGKGKEYNYNGDLEFEGEYLNGERWNGKGFNIIGEINFVFINGKVKIFKD